MSDPKLILTPDQRVRVFVSSTLEELAEERAAVRRAVESLHLAPVMFELGARAHPPRTLYQSYLEQSHVFVGLYWQRYGWVAPGMEVSGLEDEYLLAAEKPKLVYVKRPAPDREPSLGQLLDRIRDEGDVSYKAFSTPEELERQVADDLAVMLSEAFQATSPQARDDEPTRPRLPAGPTPFVGRADELAELTDLLRDANLVTLIGPGGIGKTRLALQAAADLAPGLRDGAVFVPLSSLHEPALVASAIAQALGLREDVRGGALASLKGYLRERQMLLVLDNFEHLLDARSVVTELLDASVDVKVLVTSREALRVRAERELAVSAMRVADAARLFEQRAQALRHEFRIDDKNAETIDRIVEAVDGVPLAVELAAARVRLMPPDAILQRLDRSLDFLIGGATDLPEHQRALRATLDWSHDLLPEEDKHLFARLGVFSGSFSLTAAQAVFDDSDELDMLERLASLVDKSLLRAEPSDREPRFRMLGMIAEYAKEKLEAVGEIDATGRRHSEFFRGLSQEFHGALRGPEQAGWVARLGSGSGAGDIDNLRASLRWSIDHGDLDDVAHIVWSMWLLAWISGRLQECRNWAREAEVADGRLSTAGRARLLTVAGLFEMWTGEYTTSLPALKEAVDIARGLDDDELLAIALLGLSLVTAWVDGAPAARLIGEEANALFRSRGDAWGVATSYSVLTWFLVGEDDFQAAGPIFEDAVAAEQGADELNRAMIETNAAEYRIYRGEFEDAARLLKESIDRYRSLRALYQGAYAFDATARLAAHAGRPETAAALLGFADRLRDMLEVPVEGTHRARREQLIARLGHELGAQRSAAARSEGRMLEFDEAARIATDFLEGWEIREESAARYD